ncbi:MAG: hypothetical protein KDA25_12290 [Phycisphaerales bacterium]|nr:hypothetical protein [Phycisphaerales bacterium]
MSDFTPDPDALTHPALDAAPDPGPLLVELRRSTFNRLRIGTLYLAVTAVLTIACAMAGGGIGMLVAMLFGHAAASSDVPVLVGAITGAIVAAQLVGRLLLRDLLTRIRLHEHALVLATIGRTRTIPWDDIADVQLTYPDAHVRVRPRRGRAIHLPPVRPDLELYDAIIVAMCPGRAARLRTRLRTEVIVRLPATAADGFGPRRLGRGLVSLVGAMLVPAPISIVFAAAGEWPGSDDTTGFAVCADGLIIDPDDDDDAIIGDDAIMVPWDEIVDVSFHPGGVVFDLAHGGSATASRRAPEFFDITVGLLGLLREAIGPADDPAT